jgi:hypothetical protein
MKGFGFTPLDLERAAMQSITGWVNNPPILVRNPYDPKGPPVVPTVYQGRIPSVDAGPENGLPLYKAPSIAVCCYAMSYKRESGVGTLHAAILTWDDDLTRNGYEDTANIINRLITGFYEIGVLGESFLLLDDTVHGDVILDPSVDFFGYFLGSVEAKFGLMTPGINEGPLYGSEDYTIS